MKYEFDATGRLAKIVDPQKRALVLKYSGTPSRLTRIGDTLTSSRALTITYSGAYVRTISDGTRIVTYTNTTGDLAATQSPMGWQTTYGYDAGHRIKSIAPPFGKSELITYTNGLVTAQTLPDGQQLAFSYLSATTILTTTGSNGLRTVDYYDYASNNTLIGIRTSTRNSTTGTMPSAQTVLGSSFDSSFSPGVVQDGRGNTTRTIYTATGLPLQITDALGNVTRMQYDALGRTMAMTDAIGIATQWTYDTANNVTRITAGITTTSALRATTIYTYTANKRLLTDVRAPNGVLTHYTYNALEQLTQQVVGYGNAGAVTTAYAYDAVGRVRDVVTGFGSALARTDRTDYNPDDTILRTFQNFKDGIYTPTKPDEDLITTYTYDKLGRVVAVTDPLGRITATSYNDKGQVAWTAQNVTPLQLDPTTRQPNLPTFALSKPGANSITSYTYDDLGRVSLLTQSGILTGTFNTTTRSFSQVDQRVTRTEYDALSRPVTTTLNYKPGQPVDTLSDVNVRTIMTYDTAGNVVRERDGWGRETRTGYDVLNRPLTITVNYQDGNALTGPRDADIVQVLRYDRLGRVISTTDNFVDSIFAVTQPITDRVTLTNYNGLGQVISSTVNMARGQTNPALNRQTLYSYIPTTTQLRGTRDPLDRWMNQQYDALGRVQTTIQNCVDSGGTIPPVLCNAAQTAQNDRNATTQTSYDALGRAQATLDALNHKTLLTFDGVGRTRVTTQNATGSGSAADPVVTTSQQYDAVGRTTVITDALAKLTRMTYADTTATMTTTDPLNRQSVSGADAAGTSRWQRTPDGRYTVYGIDGLGRVTSTTVNYQAGASTASDVNLTTATRFDRAGRKSALIDPAGRATTYAYDNQDNLIGVNENVGAGCKTPCNVVTSYSYDRSGNRLAITDALNHTRRTDYNAANEPTVATNALQQTVTWTYDAAGRLTSQQDQRPSNNTVSYSYDGLDRRTQTTAGSASSSASYDVLGRRLTLTDSGTTTFSYDALGRVLSAAAPQGTTSYGYNGRGDRTSITYPNSGPALSYSYYDDGHLQTVSQTSAPASALAQYAYDANGRLAQVARLYQASGAPVSGTTGSVVNYGYDGADRLLGVRTTVAGTNEGSFRYQLDRLGQRTVVTETLPLTPTISSTRLKTATFEGASLIDPVTGVSSVQGSVLLSTTRTLKGFYSAAIANATNSYLRQDFSPNLDDVYVSFYLRVDSGPTSSSQLILIGTGSGGTTTIGNLQLTNAQVVNGKSTVKLRLRNFVSGTQVQIGSDSPPLEVGQTYRVAIHQKKGTGNNGILEAFLAAVTAADDGTFGAPFAFSYAETFTAQAVLAKLGATSSTAIAVTMDDITFDGSALPPPSGAFRAGASPDAALSSSSVTAGSAAQLPQPDAAGGRGAAVRGFGHLPLGFVPNTGQFAESQVRFRGGALGGLAFFTVDETVLALPTEPLTRTVPGQSGGSQPTPVPTVVAGTGNVLAASAASVTPTTQPTTPAIVTAAQAISLAVMRLQYVGSNSTATIVGGDQLQGTTNYFLGNDSNRWRTNLPTYASLRYQQLYSGIDLRYDGTQGQFKRTFIVAPGGNPNQIRWRYQGAQDVRLTAQGTLEILLKVPGRRAGVTTSLTLTEALPEVWQTIGELDVSVAAQYIVAPDKSVSFALGSYDARQPLIIDPTLTYSSILPGSGQGIAVDSTGNAYVAGYTASVTFPTVNPVQGTIQGLWDTFVLKLNPSGTALVYSTYLGGAGDEYGEGIAVDSAGNAYVTGTTTSTNFPVTTGVFQPSYAGGSSDRFVAKLNTTGNGLLYSTYVGGNGNDSLYRFTYGHTIAVDTAGNTYITGSTDSTNLPTTTLALQKQYQGATDAFVIKINGSASNVLYASYLGGNGGDFGSAITIDTSNNAYVTGSTFSSNFPTSSSAFQKIRVLCLKMYLLQNLICLTDNSDIAHT